MKTENLEWLVSNALHGDISGDNSNDLRVMIKAEQEFHALRARVAKLEEVLKRGVELHENCDADTCMCGESMWHPLADHKPTAMLQYCGDQWAEEARRALEEK